MLYVLYILSKDLRDTRHGNEVGKFLYSIHDKEESKILFFDVEVRGFLHVNISQPYP